jgi:hypothetical protein
MFLVPPPTLLKTLFPWVEKEREAYATRLDKHGRKATDYALKHFLDVLEWFRTVILQDTAVLFSKYPKCTLWTHAPFNMPEFEAFAMSSIRILEQAEEDARRKLERLPETVATSMRGVVEAMEVRQNQDRNNLNTKLDYVQSLLLHQLGSKKRSSWPNAPKLTGMCSFKLMLLSPNSTNSIVHTAYPSRPSPMTPVTSQSQYPVPACSSSQESISPVALSPPPDTPSPPPDDLSLHPIILSNSTVVGGSELAKWPQDLHGLHSSFGTLSDCSHERICQIDAVRLLKAKFGNRIQRHQYEWVKYGSRKLSDEWLPIYSLQSIGSLSLLEIWEEWTSGLNGCLSVRELEENWAARWRRDVSGQKTEMSRRRLIIQRIIEPLSRKKNWNIQLALRYLQEQYPIPSKSPAYLRTTRSFIDYLQNKTTGPPAIENILSGAYTFCS